MRLSVPEPCHEDWSAMTPTARGRHCGACAKTVVDFTALSDDAVLAYVGSAAPGATCGRFRAEQLGRTLTTAASRAPLPTPGALAPALAVPRRRRRWYAALATGLLGLLSLGRAEAQTILGRVARPVVSPPPPPAATMGIVAPARVAPADTLPVDPPRADTARADRRGAGANESPEIMGELSLHSALNQRGRASPEDTAAVDAGPACGTVAPIGVRLIEGHALAVPTATTPPAVFPGDVVGRAAVTEENVAGPEPTDSPPDLTLAPTPSGRSTVVRFGEGVATALVNVYAADGRLVRSEAIGSGAREHAITLPAGTPAGVYVVEAADVSGARLWAGQWVVR